MQALVSCPLPHPPVEEGPALGECASSTPKLRGAPRNLPPITGPAPPQGMRHAKPLPPIFAPPAPCACVAFGGPAFATEQHLRKNPPARVPCDAKSIPWSLIARRTSRPHIDIAPPGLPSPSSLTMTIWDGSPGPPPPFLPPIRIIFIDLLPN